MITRSTTQIQPLHWRAELRRAYSDPLELLSDLDLQADSLPLAANSAGFPFRVPRPFAAKMRRADPQDPLLLQVLPRAEELRLVPGYGSDPVGELAARHSSSIIQKYHGRALLVTTGGCAINCRYCFRRHFPYGESTGRVNLDRALQDLIDDSTITEVILSGGDPLLLDDLSLDALVRRLDAITHVKRLRIHTRLPITIPARITPEFCALLERSRLSTSVVLHVNHANEIDHTLAAALAPLHQGGIVLLNQSVLLREINDTVEVLAELSEALFDCAVLPYYLHLLDPVAGAAHFDVAQSRAVALIAELRRRLPGYLVPRLVREEAGENAKSIIA